MKVLQIIHGYPPAYNAGSEVYTQTICHALSDRGHEVHVFTREEDPFAADFSLRHDRDADAPQVTLHIVNNPRAVGRYSIAEVDRCCEEVLDAVAPDIVHIGHLHHLSTSLISVIARRKIPIVFTLHDFWLMCPRGQFVRLIDADTGEAYSMCHHQHDDDCARHCFAPRFAGPEGDSQQDIDYWRRWSARRSAHIREQIALVGKFIAPSRHLLERFVSGFGIPRHRIQYLDYGLDTGRCRHRHRDGDGMFTFGYIGTHIPTKGIQHLLEAFSLLRGPARLRVWGRPIAETKYLKRLAERLLQGRRDLSVEWLPEYRNHDIVRDVFNHVDAIVVPSIWLENSPLVIHEAQQARVPVITAGAGGMAEYVAHEVNGLLYDFRSPSSLATQMQRFCDDPSWARQLGQRGYLHSASGDVIDIADHIHLLEALYRELLNHAA